MQRTTSTTLAATAAVAITLFVSASAFARPSPAIVRVRFGAGPDVAVAKGTTPVLLSKEHSDVDGDGVEDTVSYYDTDSDHAVDNEVIDLGSTGTPTILALRCDADGDGRYDDWLVVDAASEQPRAALIDSNDDGDVDRVAFADGTSAPMDGATAEMFRPVAAY